MSKETPLIKLFTDEDLPRPATPAEIKKAKKLLRNIKKKRTKLRYPKKLLEDVASLPNPESKSPSR